MISELPPDDQPEPTPDWVQQHNQRLESSGISPYGQLIVATTHPDGTAEWLTEPDPGSFHFGWSQENETHQFEIPQALVDRIKQAIANSELAFLAALKARVNGDGVG